MPTQAPGEAMSRLHDTPSRQQNVHVKKGSTLTARLCAFRHITLVCIWSHRTIITKAHFSIGSNGSTLSENNAQQLKLSRMRLREQVSGQCAGADSSYLGTRAKETGNYGTYVTAIACAVQDQTQIFSFFPRGKGAQEGIREVVVLI